MRSAALLVALVFCVPAWAQFDTSHPPPDWMVRGFEAAVADTAATKSAITDESFSGLAPFLPADRAGPLTDKLTTLLGDPDSDVRSAAAQALGNIPLGDRAGAVIDKLMPLLGDLDFDVRSAAAQALGKIATGDRAGAVIDKLMPLLGDPEGNVRSSAAQALGNLPPGKRASAVIDKLTRLLGDPEADVRYAAAQALDTMATGDRAGAVIDTLTPLLGDQDSDVRSAAAQTLGNIPLGDRAGAVIDKLMPLLGDPERNVWSSAAQALGNLPLGKRAGVVIDKLTPLLGNPDHDVRSAAAQALGKIAPGDRAGAVIDKLTRLLGDPDADVRFAATQALGNLPPGKRAGVVIDKLTPLLGDPDADVRYAAAQALGKIAPGDRAGTVIDKLTPLLVDPAGNVRSAAAWALGKLPTGEHAGAVIDKLVFLLGDGDRPEQSAAAQALGNIPLGERAGAVIDKLTPLLDDREGTVRSAAAEALGNIPLGDRAGAVIDKLTPLLGDPDSDVQYAAITAIGQIGPAGVAAEVAIIGLINSGREEDAGRWRAAAHVLTGADQRREGSELLLAWIGRPNTWPLATVTDNPAAAQRILQLLTTHWAALSKQPRAREEAENAAMAAIEAACRTPAETSGLADFARAFLAWLQHLPTEGPVHRCWTPEQKLTVEKLLADFKLSHSTHEKALEAHLKSEELAPVGLWVTRSLAAWTLWWAAFLFAFPWSRTVQAIFFWNPRARQFFSAGFVPLLLLVLPPLRRRLLAPFREDLVAQARLEDLPKLGYFADGRARVNGGAPVPLSQLRSGLRGVVVLQADSGLGKTSFLREIAARAKRPVAFLHARDCADGVDVAISRIIHDVQETGFVQSLVYTRALTVIVDGLNEVSADTREKIGGFARDMSKGDVVVATQPIEWRPPPNSRTVELLPLNRSEATAFLQSRPVGEDPNQPCHGSAYKAAVHTFVSRALDDAPSELEREMAELMLSNPFDLAFASELLARGRMPWPTGLVDEAFRLADERYREIAKVPFPLEAFGRHAVKIRLEDRNWLSADEFTAEASCLLEQRLLVSRAMKGAQGVTDRILFRHDRVWDFFIAAGFSHDPDLWAEHVGDARFRGAYLRIAETWDPESAKKVRDQLNIAAADSGDHSTSDEFIKRLEKRLRSKTSPKTLDPARTASGVR